MLNCIKKIFNKNKANESWTVLIYANGNNELEPEIYSEFLKIESNITNDNIKVLTQLARAPQDLVKLLRPSIVKNTDDWNGVRRYKTTSNGVELIEDLGNRNMADPYTLHDFIVWGMESYPSNNTMLILSGHGAGFAGVMTDFANGHQFIMPMRGLTSAIYNSKKDTKRDIDYVLLDSCYMNMIEVWHELASIPNQPIRSLLAPTKNIPIKGISYHTILKNLQTLEDTIEIYNNVEKDKLLVVKLNKKKFEKLKKSIDKFVLKYIDKDNNFIEHTRKELEEPIINILYLETLFNKTGFQEVSSHLKDIIGYSNVIEYKNSLEEGPSLYLPTNLKRYLPVKKYYRETLFSNENRWLNIIENKCTKNYYDNSYTEKSYEKMTSPIIVPIESVISVILEQNPELSANDAYEIVTHLSYKHSIY